MNGNLTAINATERQERLIREAADHRRSTSTRQSKASRRRRFSALVKDLVAASL